MEAAASLFGADGPASDPFSNLGDESDKPSAGSTTAAPAGNLFGAEPAGDADFFDQISSGNDTTDAQGGAATVGTQHDTSGAQGYATSAAEPTQQTNGTGAAYGQQGYYDGQQQWQAGSHYPSESAVRGDTYTPSTQVYGYDQYSNTASTNTTSYEQYRTPAQPAQNSYQTSSVTSSQLKTDPYAPPPSTFQSPAAAQFAQYTPNLAPTASPFATYSANTASPYAAQSATSSPYTPYATYSGASSPYMTPAAPATAPPLSKQAPARPKLANAYDPPIPTISKQKSTTRLAPAASAYGAYASPAMYGSLQQQQEAPPLPPPPPRKSSVSSQYSAPPQSAGASRFASPPPPRPASSSHFAAAPPVRPSSASHFTSPPPSMGHPGSTVHPPPARSPSVQSHYASPPPPRPLSQNWNQSSPYVPTVDPYAHPVLGTAADANHGRSMSPSAPYQPSHGSTASVEAPALDTDKTITAIDDALDPEGGHGDEGMVDPEGGQQVHDMEGGDDFEAGLPAQSAAFNAYAAPAPPPASVPLPPSSTGSPPLDRASPRYAVPAYPEFAYPSPPTSTISPPPTKSSMAPPPPRSDRSSPSGSRASSIDLTQRYGSPPLQERASSRISMRPASRTGSPFANNVSAYGMAYATPGDRTTSPVTQTTARSSYEQYAPPTQTSSAYDHYAPQQASTISFASTASPAQPAFDPYAPHQNGAAPGRVSSPGAQSVSSVRSTSSIAGASRYAAPPKMAPPPSGASAHERSKSKDSIRSVSSLSPEDPYAPGQHNRYQSGEAASDYGGSGTSRYGYTPYGMNDAGTSGFGGAQELTVKPTISQYAPSPSLLGTNDVLGRTASRAPVISFGFGGKLVSCFHGGDTLSTGFDVALAAKNQTSICMRTISKLIPETALDFPTTAFPGPLLGDPGMQTATSLVKTNASMMKAKKTSVLKYLQDRAEELSRGIAYMHSDSPEGRRAEGKLVLVKLLKVMVEHDGRLTGVSQHENAIRAALLPQLYPADGASEPSPSAYSFSTPADTAAHSFSSPGLTGNAGSDAPISVVSLHPSTLDKIQEFLRKGERRAAYNLALDEKLWAHAMVIASSVDKDAWQEVVNEFLKGELGVKGSDDLSAHPSVSNGYESLRVAYRLYSGQGPSAVQEMVPPNLLAQAAVTGLPPPSSGATPMAPNFSLPAGSSHISEEALAKWTDTLAMMYSSNMAPDVSAAITALGDQLQLNQWVEAAHACYLLSPLTSPIGGLGSPGTRIVLLGSRGPQTTPNFDKDSEAVVLSEIGEFAMSLSTPQKGQEPFRGFPHLQAYRLMRAFMLAEIGEVQLAQRYCEAISAMLAQPSPYYTMTMLEQLKELSNRIAGNTEGDKSASWIGGKISKPSLASVGGFLEKRLTQLVAGADTEAEPEPKKTEAFSGPFALYSAISSTEPSPNPSVTNLHEGANAYGPPGRSSSAAEVRRTAPPPLNRTASVSVSYGAPFGHSPNPYAPVSALSPIQDESSLQTDQGEQPDQGQEVTWWGAGSYSNSEQSSQTPKATSFVHVSDGLQVPSSSDGFISLMDSAPSPFSAPPSSMSFRNMGPPSSQSYDDEDMEDLGFGNSKKDKARAQDDGATQQNTEPAKPAAPERPDPQPVQQSNSGSSRGSWWPFSWKKSSEAQGPGPIKASLGEETSFYYDKEQKRWVNKKAGADDAKPSAPPPPPPRAQTASPGMMASGGPRMTAAPPLSGSRPPARAASVAEMASGPPPGKTIPRVRSNLVPTPEGGPSMPSSPLPGSSMLAPPGAGTPPPGRPRSSASKRPARSRYVDVFNQPGQ